MKKQSLFTLLSLLALTVGTLHSMDSYYEERERDLDARIQAQMEESARFAVQRQEYTQLSGEILLGAADRGDVEGARGIIERGPLSIFALRSALHTASSKGHGDIVRMILTRTSKDEFILPKCLRSINASDVDGKTPLMCAAEGAHRDVVELLLQNGAAANKQDVDGLTASDWTQDPVIKRILTTAGSGERSKCPRKGLFCC